MQNPQIVKVPVIWYVVCFDYAKYTLLLGKVYFAANHIYPMTHTINHQQYLT